ncbi:Mog1p/PsbP-like protein [Corynespora cassiicola Philippines]|uniref:Mog1p/PsbP-like protein n=1 Tax=Corynespora cassiicola Philippines TaxID=1448308 RepID=A0A2T2NC58_CORCC|nr:Mog1p/PsbP-like protein [Corynespora cassiicola Philippines]
MSTFKTIPLYGGAITVDLPTRFVDSSQIRQIPDHQEVYLENDGYSSVVVEILERVERASDEEALQHHFADLTDGTGDRTSVLGIEGVGVARVADKPAYTLSFIQTPQPAPDSRKKEPEYVAIHLLLLRLKEQTTDILVSVNVPHYAGEYEKASAEGEKTALMKEGDAIMAKILETFEVRDYGLFN